MTFANNAHLRHYLIEGGLSHLAVYASFEFEADRFEERLVQVRTQHPYLDQDEAAARAAYRMLASQAKRHKKIAKIKKRLGIRFWIIVAAVLLAGLLCAIAHAEPTPQQMSVIRNAMRGVNLLAPMGSGLAGPAPQQPNGIILQFRQSSSTLATRPAGLVILDCTTNMTCSFSGNTFTLTSSGGGGAHNFLSSTHSDTTPASPSRGDLVTGQGASPTWSRLALGAGGLCLTSNGTDAVWGSCSGGATTWSSLTAGTNSNAGTFAASGNTWDFAASTLFKLRVGAGLTTSANGDLGYDTTNTSWKAFQGGADRFLLVSTNKGSANQIPINNGDGTFTIADPLVSGITAHDAAGSTTNPVAIGGYASAAAPADVSADNDITRAWFLRNGSQVFNLASGGSLVTLGQKAMSASLPVVLPSDQTVSVTGPLTDAQLRATPVPVSGTVSIGTFPDNEPINVAQMNGVAVTMGNGVAGTGVQRVAVASDNSAVSGFGVGATGSAVPANAVYQGVRTSSGLTGLIGCNNTALYSNTTNGNTELVALTGGQTIYICSWQISTSQTTAVSVRLVRGTGTACATGETSITPTYPVQAATSTGPIGLVGMMSPFWQGLAGASGDAICIETNAAVSVQAFITYTKY